MPEVMAYGQPLRAIGQDLESLNVQSFEMEPAGDLILVRGVVAAAGKRHLTARSSVGSADWDNGAPDAKGQTRRVRILYSARDIELLERAGRARRESSAKVADASSLSQVLRCVGGYLHQKCARLLKLTRVPESLALEYETSLGNRMKETFAVGDLYDLWVRMYLQRQGRVSDR